MIFLGVNTVTWAEESWMAEVVTGRCTEWPRARYLVVDFASGSCLDVCSLSSARAVIRAAASDGVGVDSCAYERAPPVSCAKEVEALPRIFGHAVDFATKLRYPPP